MGVTHPIETVRVGAERYLMLRRAAHCMVIALIAAIFGFTGILHWTAAIAQAVFFVCFGMSMLSLLFSLFEEPATPGPRELPIKPQVPIHH